MESILTKLTTYKHPICFTNEGSMVYYLPLLFFVTYICNIVTTIWFVFYDYNTFYEYSPHVCNVLVTAQCIYIGLLTLLFLSSVMFKSLFKTNILMITMAMTGLIQFLLSIVLVADLKRIPDKNKQKRIHTELVTVMIVGLVNCMLCFATTTMCYCMNDESNYIL